MRIRRQQPAADGKELDAGAVGEQAPQAARRKQHHRDADQSQRQQIPGAIMGQAVLQQEEDDHADNRSFDGADAADDDDEDHIGRPVDDRKAASGEIRAVCT
jgi:hypothetical protein